MKLTAWMEGDCWHRMHVRFSNVLDHDGDIEVPCPYGLVIRRRDKATVFINEGDSVHRPQMLVVFLGNLTRVHIILQNAQASSIPWWLLAIGKRSVDPPG